MSLNEGLRSHLIEFCAIPTVSQTCSEDLNVLDFDIRMRQIMNILKYSGQKTCQM